MRARTNLLSLVVALLSVASAPAVARDLTFEQRVEAQRAMEQVQWNHRIWPKENRTAKPPLSTVLSDAAIRAKVDDSLRKSSAIEALWHRPVSTSQLQAELERMARGTKDPAMLRVLFEALGSDAFLIAETLARPALADRLLRTWYASDDRFHGALRRQVEAARAACAVPSCMNAMGGEYQETTWKLEEEAGSFGEARERHDDPSLRLDRDEWEIRLSRLAAKLGASPDDLPLRRLSGVDETSDAFFVTTLLSRGDRAMTTATVRWPKRSFDLWWAAARSGIEPRVETASSPFTLPAVPSSPCTVDTWDLLPYGVPEPRSLHTAVWTGSEMIVWGGFPDTNTGGQYDPATDTWAPTSAGPNLPSARSRHTVVWTGTEMIVWGGTGVSFPAPGTGGRYNPATETWTATSTGTNTPTTRTKHTAVWTGSEMIVWGGVPLGGGGRYNPSSNSWTPITAPGGPFNRYSHSAVWTGTEMIVWGGWVDNNSVNTGGRYSPTANTWTATSTGANLPSNRHEHTAVWTGSEMIVWGGGNGRDTGGRYNPSTNTWQPTSMGPNLPAARTHHAAVWTGAEMIVWGGELVGGSSWNTGGRYNPATDAWAATSVGASVPSARIHPSAVWTGSEVIVWGGAAGSTSLDTGARYSPTANTWTATAIGGFVPDRRYWHTAVWTGSEMIVWGGYDSSFLQLKTGGRYVPATDTWIPTSTGANVPDARAVHSAVWTGSEVIVWGGSGAAYLNTGGRYQPTTDTWLPTSTGAGVPAGRGAHSAVWTGAEMIVWGGAFPVTGSGGRYDPSSDTWIPTSMGANVPGARFLHTAVLAGEEMIVWGGTDGTSNFNTGGRYAIDTDTWSPPTSTGANAPGARTYHSAVWTGTEMIVWGGCLYGSSTYYNTGGRYDPSNDVWSQTSTGPVVPTARCRHTSQWTGDDMIVWGGDGSSGEVNTGGRYDPSADAWTATSLGASVPVGRDLFTAVLTGREMIVWAGNPATSSGGLYCACPDGALVYRDADGDGYGDGGLSVNSCTGAVPTGYVVDAGDCDDSTAGSHPGALEICDGLDNDCSGVADDGILPPSAAPSVTLARSGANASVDWSAIAGATGYDVVEGDLVALRSSGGNFTISVLACLANDLASTSVISTSTPAPGAGAFHLVRGVNCAGPGSYDEPTGNQQGNRDAEIAASGFACP